LIEKTSSATCVTALYKCRTRESLIVRLYNLTDERVEEHLQAGREIAEVCKVDLLEDRLERIDSDRNDVTVAIEGHEIVTLEIVFR
jgi:alpha-mannosidase